MRENGERDANHDEELDAREYHARAELVPTERGIGDEGDDGHDVRGVEQHASCEGNDEGEYPQERNFAPANGVDGLLHGRLPRHEFHGTDAEEKLVNLAHAQVSDRELLLTHFAAVQNTAKVGGHHHKENCEPAQEPHAEVHCEQRQNDEKDKEDGAAEQDHHVVRAHDSLDVDALEVDDVPRVKVGAPRAGVHRHRFEEDGVREREPHFHHRLDGAVGGDARQQKGDGHEAENGAAPHPTLRLRRLLVLEKGDVAVQEKGHEKQTNVRGVGAGEREPKLAAVDAHESKERDGAVRLATRGASLLHHLREYPIELLDT
mmetsp:Transcript_13792/g.45359  ORF Transcript_13792/g.45359 Transcript_13792/m.45359 type:complete len:318 (-) Transcript_13792:110-1063(-)